MAQQIEQPTPAAISEMIDEATKLLIEAAHPEKTILFGSYAPGDFTRESDLDLLVILPTIHDRREEMVRLRRALKELPMAIDVVVYSEVELERRRNLRGTMLYHALREGIVLHDAA
jgi:predicted nucleotidyltransferase